MKKSSFLAVLSAVTILLSAAFPAASADSAFVQLRTAAPALSVVAAPQAPRAAISAPSAAAVVPGKDLSPKFSDPGRVSLILKIVAPGYNGGALPFPKDGIVFENKEGRLPGKPKGYYREYTVLPPPGAPSSVTVGDQTFEISPPQGRRGAERLVIGGGELLYYSPDHYKTFLPLTVLR